MMFTSSNHAFLALATAFGLVAIAFASGPDCESKTTSHSHGHTHVQTHSWGQQRQHQGGHSAGQYSSIQHGSGHRHGHQQQGSWHTYHGSWVQQGRQGGHAPYPVSVHLRVDDDYQLFQAGKELTSSEAHLGWRTWHTFALNPAGGVLAIDAKNTGGPAGIVAEITYSNGYRHSTAKGWKCSHIRPAVDDNRWLTDVSFSSSKFTAAVPDHSRHVGGEFSHRAQWFWTSSSHHMEVYCRMKLY